MKDVYKRQTQAALQALKEFPYHSLFLPGSLQLLADNRPSVVPAVQPVPVPV